MYAFNHLCRCKVQNLMCYVIWTLRISGWCRWFVWMKGKQRSMLRFKLCPFFFPTMFFFVESTILFDSLEMEKIHRVVVRVLPSSHFPIHFYSNKFLPLFIRALFFQRTHILNTALVLNFFHLFFLPCLVLLCKVTRGNTKVACPLCTLFNVIKSVWIYIALINVMFVQQKSKPNTLTQFGE